MPPKKGNAPSKKAQQKQQQKVIEDKTFGLKNKNKSKNVQKYIKSVNAQVKNQSAKDRAVDIEKKKKKEQEKEKLKMESELFKPAVSKTKVPVGVDPKSVVCEFFKKGICTKGAKCKFSHNLETARKAEKPDLYTDQRDVEKENDTMDSWDQDKLEKVVESKRTKTNKNLKTTIVCKYFLDAIKNKKYGWFWECPNGGDKCQYQHCLPPGFVLKEKKKEEEEPEEKVPMEELLEEERAKLKTRTPITLERFLEWRKKRRERILKESKKKDTEVKLSKAMRSGREMFELNPELFADEEGSIESGDYVREEEEGPVHYLEATETSLTRTTVDGSKKKSEENKTPEKHEIQENLFTEEEIPDEDE